MLPNLVEQGHEDIVFSDVAGARVLCTGVLPDSGLAFVEAFAWAGAQLRIHSLQAFPEIEALVAGLDRSGADVTFEAAPFASAAAAVRFTQRAARSFGGLDAVVNFIAMSPAGRDFSHGPAGVEDAIHDVLLPASLITRVAANRMRITLIEGSILNVLVMPPPATRAEAALAGYARAAVAAMTRAEAREWAPSGIRINAITSSEVETGDAMSPAEAIAGLALCLASHRGRLLSGYVFDAASYTGRC